MRKNYNTRVLLKIEWEKFYQHNTQQSTNNDREVTSITCQSSGKFKLEVGCAIDAIK